MASFLKKLGDRLWQTWKPALFSLGMVVLIAASLFPYQKAITTFVWEKTRQPFLVTLLSPSDANLHFTMAEYYFHHGAYDIEQAKYLYERTILLNPQHLEAHYQLGRIYFIQSQFWLALDHIRIVLNLDPEYKRGYYMHGLIHGYSGNMIQAIYGFEEFIKRDDFNWAGYNDLAWVYFQIGDFGQTLEVATRGLERAAGNPWLHNMRGLALMNLGKSEEARTDFLTAHKRVLEMTPADWGIAYPGNDPTIYAEGLKRMQEAIEHNLALIKTE
ncbi:MAG: tetratricopeptide repeat protein [Candidatus Moraniibacteriota bacterium]|nr:MAG: tetratricopeptide repeat protein [Candidatus Moranbacteria bacterium]